VYDGSAVKALVSATGDRTTYTSSPGQAAVLDPRGKRTTLLYDGGNNLAVGIRPTGARASGGWGSGLPRGVQDPLGNRTTFTQTTLSNRTQALASVVLATGGSTRSVTTPIAGPGWSPTRWGGGRRSSGTRAGGGRGSSTRWATAPVSPTTAPAR